MWQQLGWLTTAADVLDSPTSRPSAVIRHRFTNNRRPEANVTKADAPLAVITDRAADRGLKPVFSTDRDHGENVHAHSLRDPGL